MKNVFSFLILFSTFLLFSAESITVSPGYEICGFEIPFRALEKTVQEIRVLFREKGGTVWKKGFSPVRIPQEGVFRGSLSHLKENTAYEYSICDGVSEITGTFITRKTDLPIAKEIVLSNQNFDGELLITEGGSPDGYIRYTMEPGGILQGKKGRFAVIRIMDASHIILDGLTVRGNQNFHGIHLENARDIHILNCDISGYAIRGIQRPDRDGKYYSDSERRPWNFHSGVYLLKSEDIRIERCYIHDPAGQANSWFHSHPSGPNAVMVYEVKNLALRYNDFIGNDRERWNDAVEDGANGSPKGGPFQNAEIKGNYFVFTNDDGMELDGGQRNANVFYNKFESFFCGISTAPCLQGPSYIYDNLFVSPGDQFGQSNVAFKNNFSIKGYGKVHFIGNTVVGACNGFSTFSGMGKNMEKAFFCNNLFSLSGTLFYDGVFRDRIVFDSNLVRCNSQETIHQVQEKIREEAVVSKPSLYAQPLFECEGGTFMLSADSPGRGMAQRLPNFQEEFGADPGAVRRFELPFRPIDLMVNKRYLVFDETVLEQDVLLSAGKNFQGHFFIRKNAASDYFSIFPESGYLRPGETKRLKVRMDPQKLMVAKRHKAVFLIRNEFGFSRPVFLEFDNSKNRNLVRLNRKGVLYADKIEPRSNGETTLEFKIPKTGNYYLFLFTKDSPYAIDISSDGAVFLKGRLYGSRFREWCWQAILPEQKNISANRPFSLKEGNTFKVVLRQRWGWKYQIRNAALAEFPEQMLYAPEVE